MRALLWLVPCPFILVAATLLTPNFRASAQSEKSGGKDWRTEELGGTPIPNKYPTVTKYLDAESDFHIEEGTLKVLSDRPLHIQVSPRVTEKDEPEVIQNLTDVALVQTVYDSFVRTPVDKFTVTAIPAVEEPGEIGEVRKPVHRFLSQYRVTVTTTRKRALAILNHYFPGKGFEDLENTRHMPTEISEAISEVGNKPGAKAILVDLARNQP